MRYETSIESHSTETQISNGGLALLDPPRPQNRTFSFLDEKQKRCLTALEQLGTTLVTDFSSMAESIFDIIRQSVPFDSASLIRHDSDSLQVTHFHSDRPSINPSSLHAEIPTLQQLKTQRLISVRGSDLDKYGIKRTPSNGSSISQSTEFPFSLTTACIDPEGNHTGLVILQRSGSGTDFSGEERSFLGKVSFRVGALLLKTPLPLPDPEPSELLALVGQRASPGVIVMGRNGEILFINGRAEEIINREGRGIFSKVEKGLLTRQLHQITSQLFSPDRVEENRKKASPSALISLCGVTYLLRGVALEGTGREGTPGMILIEPVQERVQIDSESPSVADNLGFTRQEKAIAKLISRGLTNKEIASALGIGVYTVKDHVKNILKKVKATTRAGIVAKVITQKSIQSA
ncbi:MAG: LuxR C-terminal-related transcriptional regulator [Candidatus Manganitrophaceae bacterium]